MNSANRFRVGAIVVAVLMMAYALTSLFSEIFSLSPPRLPANPSQIAQQPIGPLAQWAFDISPFRADLEGSYASAVALAALRPNQGTAQQNANAQGEIARVLKSAPYRSDLWLLLALLQTQQKNKSQSVIEALKMSYFTAPNDGRLMPSRTYTVAVSDALSDADLRELARGDIRLMLRQSSLREALVSAYKTGSNVGKAFIEEVVQSIEPPFVSALRSPG